MKTSEDREVVIFTKTSILGSSGVSNPESSTVSKSYEYDLTQRSLAYFKQHEFLKHVCAYVYVLCD